MTSEERLDKQDDKISQLLLIAENHTVQIGLLMKVMLGGIGLMCLSVLGALLAKIGLPLVY